MALSCPKYSFGGQGDQGLLQNQHDWAQTHSALPLPELSPKATQELLIKAKQMQCKTLHPFPVISAWWRGFRGPPGPREKAPLWARHATPLIPYIKIPSRRSTVRLKGQDPRCTQCLSLLFAVPGPKHRRWRPPASPGATCRGSAKRIPHWAALHFLEVGKGSTKSSVLHLHIQTLLSV